MSKIEEYQARKAQLQTELDIINRDIIINEQSIKQQEELFVQQFGTTDIVELEKIAVQYQEAIVVKEAELEAIENV